MYWNSSLFFFVWAISVIVPFGQPFLHVIFPQQPEKIVFPRPREPLPKTPSAIENAEHFQYISGCFFFFGIRWQVQGQKGKSPIAKKNKHTFRRKSPCFSAEESFESTGRSKVPQSQRHSSVQTHTHTHKKNVLGEPFQSQPKSTPPLPFCFRAAGGRESHKLQYSDHDQLGQIFFGRIYKHAHAEPSAVHRRDPFLWSCCCFSPVRLSFQDFQGKVDPFVRAHGALFALRYGRARTSVAAP